MSLSNVLLCFFIVISGGLAGVITNKIAICHLFRDIHFFGKKTKPFKSVIAETREELAESLSNLVAEKIITPEKMFASKGSNSILFEEKFNEEINKFLLKADKSKALQKSIADFDKDGLLETIAGKTTDKIISENFDYFVNAVLSEISLDELIDKEMVCSILEELLPIVVSAEKLNKYLLEFLEDNREITFKTLLGENVYFDVKKNFEDITRKALNNTVSKDMPAVIETVENIIYETEFEKYIKRALRQTANRKISSLLGNADNVDFNNDILMLIKDVIKSNDFKNIVKSKGIFKLMYEGLTNIDLHIKDILPKEFWNNINKILPEKIREIIPVIRGFIRENETDILSAVDSALKNAIERRTSDRPFANKIRKLLKNIIAEKIWDRVGGEYKIINSINNMLEKSDVEITKSIMEFINNNFKDMSVPELIDKLTDDGRNSDKYTKIIYEMVYRNINKSEDNKILIFILDKIGSLSLSTFISEETIDSIYDTGKNKLMETFEREIVKKGNIDNMSGAIADLLDEYCNKSLYDFVIESDYHINIGEKNICDKIINFLLENLYEKPVKDIFGKRNIMKLTKIITDKSGKFMKNLYNRNWGEKFNDILAGLFKKNGWLRTVILDNGIIKFLPVKKMISNGVKEMDADDLCKKMNDFFGKELKPLEMLGMVMGAVAGALIWFFRYGSKAEITCKELFLFDFNWWLLLSLVIFAGIGIGTNAVAVKFLFWPYKKLLNCKYLQGYICRDKNKKRCADGIADFIDENFLNQKIDLKDILQNKLSFYSGNNFARARDELKNNKSKLTSWVLDAVDSNCGRISKFVAASIYDYAETNSLNKIIGKNNANEISDYFVEFLKGKSDYFAELAAEKLTEIKLNDLFEADKHSDKMSEKIIKYVQFNVFDEAYIKNMLKKFSGDFDNFRRKEVTDLITESDTCHLINGFIFSSETKALVNRLLNNVFEAEFNNTKTLGTIFDGAFKKLINDNIDVVFDILKFEIKSKINNEYFLRELSKSISDGIKKEQGLVGKFGGKIIDQENLVKETLVSFFKNDFDRLLEKNETKIKKLLRDNIFEKVFNIRISSIINDANKINLNILVDKFFDRIPYHMDFIESMTEKAVGLFFNTASKKNIKVDDLLRLLKINKLEDVYDRFAVEINEIIYSLKNKLNLKSKTFENEIGSLINKIIEDNYLNLDVNDFIKNISRTEIKKQTLKVFSDALESVYVKFYFADCIESMPVTYLSDVVYEREIEETINRIIKYITEDSSVLRRSCEKTINGVIDTLCGDDYGIFQNKDAMEVFESILEGVTESIDELDIKGITDCLELKKVMYDSIVNLSGKEIHEFFNAFAKKYLKSLKWMGWMGVFFGFANLVSALVALYYWFWLKKELEAGEKSNLEIKS